MDELVDNGWKYGTVTIRDMYEGNAPVGETGPIYSLSTTVETGPFVLPVFATGKTLLDGLRTLDKRATKIATELYEAGQTIQKEKEGNGATL